jgi:hypothetical protein
MMRKITVVTARTQFGQIMAAAPDWFEKSWDSAKREGLDKLTMEEIDAEIAAARRDRRERCERQQQPGQ